MNFQADSSGSFDNKITRDGRGSRSGSLNNSKECHRKESSTMIDRININGVRQPSSSGAQVEAENYLEAKKIFELIRFLIGHLLVDEPDDPVAYLRDLLDKCVLFRSGLAEPPLFFDTRGGGGRGVRPVYLRCSRGTVAWRYPRGALRIVLSGGGDGRTFRGCVKVSGPARVYLEGKGTLRPIYSPGDGKHEALHRCFHSRGQLAALYVEADDSTTDRSAVKLRYDLELASPHAGKDTKDFVDRDEETECRPCSKEELAEAYCKSDLVARGTVSAVERRPDLEAAELVLRVTKSLRRVEENEDNEVDSGDLRFQGEIRVRVSTACDARHGQGEFVIMARKKLGDLTLACAPRLEAWAEAVRELKSAPCFLRS